MVRAAVSIADPHYRGYLAPLRRRGAIKIKGNNMKKTTILDKPCPECYSECMLCGMYRCDVRYSGCPGDFGFPKCDKNKEKGTVCGTCDGSQRIKLKVEVTKLKVIKGQGG